MEFKKIFGVINIFTWFYKKWIIKIKINTANKTDISHLASVIGQRPKNFQSSTFGFGSMWKCSFGHLQCPMLKATKNQSVFLCHMNRKKGTLIEPGATKIGTLIKPWIYGQSRLSFLHWEWKYALNFIHCNSNTNLVNENNILNFSNLENSIVFAKVICPAGSQLKL